MCVKTFDMIRSKPMFGFGSGSYKYNYEKVVANDYSCRNLGTDNPHQQYLVIAAEQATLSLAVFLLVLFS
jgi:O-antigen ligase